MSNQNFFALLDDDETDEPQAIIARAAAPVAAEKAAASKKAPAKPKSAPLPNAIPKEVTTTNGNESRGGRGGRGGRGRGGRGVRGGDRDATTTEFGDSASSNVEKSDREYGGRGFFRGRGGRGRGGRGFSGEGDERRFRREFDRQPGTGRGHEIKREGAGRGNWGVEGELPVEEAVAEAKESPTETTEVLPNGTEEDKPAEVEAGAEETTEEKVDHEPKEMTLDEYEKMMDEKRKQLMADKKEIRKVELDKELESMTIMKKTSEEDLVFAKLGEGKEKKKRSTEEEKKPKAININEFLKPAEGETYYPPRNNRGRGRGRGRGFVNRVNGGYHPASSNIDTGDQSQFPTLGA